MRQRSLAMSTSRRNEIVAAMFESQYLVGAVSPSGHSISNVSCGRAAAPVLGAVRTCTRAKRERDRPAMRGHEPIRSDDKAATRLAPQGDDGRFDLRVAMN